jgi:hypothetical protein
VDYDNWIKIEDKLPESNKDFLALWDDGEICVEIWNDHSDYSDIKSFHDSWNVYNSKILYWQPLPELPPGFKERNNGKR